MTRLDPDADTAELGRTLISALLSSAQGVAFSDYTSLARERFAASGFASEAVFMKSAALVSAELTAGHLVLTPHRNGGSSGDQRGFHGLPGKALLVREHFQGEMIGPMIFEAWELCE